jgi:hypothetical protein
VSKKDSSRSGDAVPYVLEFERSALSILKDDANHKEQIKELLEEYAARYAEESTSGA